MPLLMAETVVLLLVKLELENPERLEDQEALMAEVMKTIIILMVCLARHTATQSEKVDMPDKHNQVKR